MSKYLVTKISLFFLILSLGSCNIYRKIPEGKYLLRRNKIIVNGEKEKSAKAEALILQTPNTTVFGYPILADIYTIADQNPDLTYYKWIKKHQGTYNFLRKAFSRKQVIQLQQYYKGINNVIKEIGEPPVYVDSSRIKKTAKRLKFHYISNSYLDATQHYEIEKIDEYKANVIYKIDRKNSYTLQKFGYKISSPALQELYKKHKKKNEIHVGKKYERRDFVAERTRLSRLFRNNGIYHFQPSYIKFDLVFDSIHQQRNLEAHLKIPDRNIQKGDSTLVVPFLKYQIKNVNVYISGEKNPNLNMMRDSVEYEGIHLHSTNEKLRYRPKALTQSIFIRKGELYSDLARLRTHRQLMSLQNFKQAYVQYIENEKDTTLTANIFLIPEKRYGIKGSGDATHSNIHDLGLKASASVSAKNLFRGAEILNLSFSVMTAASKESMSLRDNFFDVRELELAATLNFPRILFPYLNRYIPKYMMPKTRLTFLTNTQTNIGLDRRKYAGIFGYEWKPAKEKTHKIDLLNLEFITNLNAKNYYKIYSNTYDRLSAIASGLGQTIAPETANQFIVNQLNDASFCAANPNICTDLRNIKEREQRITQNIFIISNTYDYLLDTRVNPLDNNFFLLETYFELAGSVLSPLGRIFNLPKNDLGQRTINNVPYAEYIKTNFNYIKHWDFKNKNVLAYRIFFGVAIPYGNSRSIPFVSSYFGGGSNDIRAWRAYSLGPGTTAGLNEFNEANLKFTTNLEYRFPLAGYFHGAVFVDAGNIWNLNNNATDSRGDFKGFESLRDIAAGTGVGLRVDFDYFIFRFDFAFKTYDPSKPLSGRWFNKESLRKSVFNFGINYPF